MKILIYIVTFIVVMILFSCDAPHINPLDPDNPDNEYRALKGRVLTETIPRQPIQGVNVSWRNDNIVVQTNSNGEFSLEKLSDLNGYLVFSKEGYLTDSLKILWGNDKIKSVNRFLNSIPKIGLLKIYSTVVNRYAPNEPIITLTVEADLLDEEKDVDTVFIENSELKIIRDLVEITGGKYKREFSRNELGLESMEELIGKEISIVVKDKNQNRFTLAKSNLKRIIKQEIETLSPKNTEDSVSVTPILKWKRYTPGFKFKYFLQVRTNDVFKDLVWERENIAADSIQIKVNQKISGNPTNEYYWVIGAVDDFNNITISKPASFKVLP